MSSFTDKIKSKGFKEYDFEDNEITDADYSTGWHGLSTAKPSAIFRKGNKEVFMRLSYWPGGVVKQEIYAYDKDGEHPNIPVYVNKEGVEPGDDFWTSFD